jgi:hypothetical protein
MDMTFLYEGQAVSTENQNNGGTTTQASQESDAGQQAWVPSSYDEGSVRKSFEPMQI